MMIILHSRKFRIIFIVALLIIAIYNLVSYNPSSPIIFDGIKSQAKVQNDYKNIKQLSLNPPDVYSPELSLEEQLAFHFPYEPEKPFPKFIWQTWKYSTDDKSFPSRYRHIIDTWKNNNPAYSYRLLLDDQAAEFINQLYSKVPDVARAYNIMPHNILKADFFRYLIIFAKGGVYSDVDTVNLKPIDTWASINPTALKSFNLDTVSQKLQEQRSSRDDADNLSIGFTISIEADPDRPDWAEWYARRIQFCQWTFQGKPGHPLLAHLISKITRLTLNRQENGDIRLSTGSEYGADIMDWTGPGIFTDSIFDYLNNITEKGSGSFLSETNTLVWDYNEKLKEPEHGLSKTDQDNPQSEKNKINWKLFSGIYDPIILDDVLILPITGFSPGVNAMGSKMMDDELAYVQHLFSGSWKNDL